MTAFWVVALYKQTDVSEVFIACIIRAMVIAMITEAAGCSETSVNFHQTTRRYNPKDNQFNTHHCENLIYR
jgi:hypothetical protein